MDQKVHAVGAVTDSGAMEMSPNGDEMARDPLECEGPSFPVSPHHWLWVPAMGVHDAFI